MKCRRGITVLEIAVAALLMGLLLGLCVKMLAWSVRERRAVERRSVALIEANNILDQATRLTWEEMTEENLKALQVSEEALALLPGATLEFFLISGDLEPRSKQVSVEIEWPGSHGQREGSVLLNAWKFQKGVADDPS